MNVYLEVTAPNWPEKLPKLQFYAEEADLRLDAGEPIMSGPVHSGTRLKCPQANAIRFNDILQKAGLTDVVKLQVRLILPQHDPAEAEIQSKLYRDGRGPTPAAPDRTPPSEDLRYTMSAEEYSEYMRGLGVRARA